jgi:hypothetical protein
MNISFQQIPIAPITKAAQHFKWVIELAQNVAPLSITLIRHIEIYSNSIRHMRNCFTSGMCICPLVFTVVQFNEG